MYRAQPQVRQSIIEPQDRKLYDSSSQSLIERSVPKSASVRRSAEGMFSDCNLHQFARNEWICWVISVNKPETRRQRVRTELKEGMRRHSCCPGCPHRRNKNGVLVFELSFPSLHGAAPLLSKPKSRAPAHQAGAPTNFGH